MRGVSLRWNNPMHLIIDGYNVMHALPVEKEWPGKASKDRRAFFVEKVRAYLGGRNHRATLVFDGAKGGEDMGGHETHGRLEVQYSRRGEEADDVIKRMLEESGNPREVLVVSSDKGITGYVRSLGASVAGAHELVKRLMPNPPGGGSRSAASAFERGIKGYDPDDGPRMSRPRSGSALQLW